MFGKTMINVAVAGLFAQAEKGNTVGGAVADLSKAMKSKVPAGIDFTKEMTACAVAEAKAIGDQINLFGTRMDQWLKVAKMGAAKPELFKAYPDMVRAQLLILAGLPEKDVSSKKELWPQPVQELYERHLSKRISETRKAMGALTDHYGATLKVLSGKGSIHDKLRALPNPTKRGRTRNPAGATTAGDADAKTKGKPTQGPKPAEPHQDRLKAVAEHLGQMSPADLYEVAVMVGANLKQRKEYKADKAIAKFTDTLHIAMNIYLTETAVEADGEGRSRAQR